MKRVWIACFVAAVACVSGRGVLAQEAGGGGFSKEQLEQMVAPIALYPDSLVSAVLMAATYPLEVVEADRWVKQNASLKGDALNAALKSKTWDDSIKSVVAVPEVLTRMSENLDWTRDLGDAFLGQKADLMDAVQRMRGKANEAGNLKTSEQQTVTVNQDQTIVIESTSPEVCYVPTYSTVVYGSGWAYPTPYYPYMYPPGWGLLSFGAGVAVGGALWGNCNWGWGRGDVDINVNNYNNWGNKVNNNFNNVSNNKWNHNANHRQGVAYKNNQVAQKYGGSGASNRIASDRARGRGDGANRPSQLPANRPGGGAGAGNRPNVGGGDRPNVGGGDRPNVGGGDRPGAGGGNRPGAGGGNRPGAGGGMDRPSPGGAGGAANRPSQGGGAGAGARPSPQPSQRPAAKPSGGFSGASSPRTDRAASNRGSMSRGGGGGGGGGARGGGGGRGGGGRGRR